jgi:hypothetical protein
VVTGDHIRQRLADTLAAHEPVLYGIDHRARCHCGWIGTADAGEPARHRAAALEQTVRDLIADELDAAAFEWRSLSAGAAVARADLNARAAALRARTEETTT